MRIPVIKRHLALLGFFISLVSLQAQNSYTLQKALQAAKANNPVLKTERFNTNILQADQVTSRLNLNPVLSNQSIQVMQSSSFAPNTNWNNALNRQVSWQIAKPFQIAGQRKNKIDFANKNVNVAENNYAETERNLFTDVANKWLEAWTAQKQLDLIRIAKINVDSLVSTNQLRFKNQVITQTDLLRTELLQKQYMVQSKNARQDVSNRLNELKFLLGVKESVTIDTTDNFLFQVPVNIDTLLSQSLKNRSDIKAVKSQIEASVSNINLQKSLVYSQPQLGFIYNPQNAVPYFGIVAAIDLPVFNRNQGEIQKSLILKQQGEQQLFTVQSKLQTEISTAFTSYQVQQQNIQSLRIALVQSQSILDNVKYSYLKGGTTIIDFLEAQRSWLETQQQYYEVLHQYRQSYIQLLNATGLINQLAQ